MTDKKQKETKQIKENMHVVSVRLNEEDFKTLQALAFKNVRSFGGQIIVLIREHRRSKEELTAE